MDKLLTHFGCGTRRQVIDAVRRGRARVNGKTCCDPAAKVDPERDEIRFDGVVQSYQKHRYLLMNKPAGVITAVTDRRETVLDLLPEQERRGLFPVGRLDKDTEGLLILTTDGQLCHALMSPRRHVEKVYLAGVSGTLAEDAAARFAAGLTLRDGTVCRPAVLEPVGLEPAGLTLRDGTVCRPAVLEPAGLEPAGLTLRDGTVCRPAGLEPAVPEPAGLTLRDGTVCHPAVLEPVGLEPAGPEPVGLEPAVLEPAGLTLRDGTVCHPVGLEPAVLEPAGLTLRDGTVCRPAGPEPAGQTDGLALWRVTLQEGKYHQVKRMIAAVGGHVETLRRIAVGPLALPPGLPPGAYRPLTAEELGRLLAHAGDDG